MSYRIKGHKVIINGEEQIIVPSSLPVSPTNGYIAIDSSDNKLKVYHASKSRWIVLGDAEDQAFDNSTNGFIAVNTQTAIEEARSNSTGSLIPFEYWNNGTSANAWLNTAGSPLPSNSVFRVVPLNCKLVGMTFTNAANNVDLDVRVNIANYSAGSTINRTVIYEIRNKRTYRTFDFDNESDDVILNAGDKIGVYIQDQGDNPNDPVVTLYLKVLEETDGTLSENFSTSITVTIGPITIILG